MEIYEETSLWLHNMNSPMNRQTNRPLNLYFFNLFNLIQAFGAPIANLSDFP